MKKLLLLTKTILVAALLGVGTSAWGAYTTYWTEDFEDDLGSGWTLSEASIVGNSTMGKILGEKDLRMPKVQDGKPNGSYIITPTLSTGVSTITFWQCRTSDRTLAVYTSTDGGTNWTKHSDVTAKSDAIATVEINNYKVNRIKIANETDGGDADIDDLTVYDAYDVVYSKALSGWADTDVADWGSVANLTASTTTGLGFKFNSNGKSFSASKTFVITATNPLIKYEVDWNISNSMGRKDRYNMIQFGNKIRIGLSGNGNGSNMADANYALVADLNGSINSTSSVHLYTPGNAALSTHIVLMVNTVTNKIEKLTIGGTDYTSKVSAVISDATYNSVTFGTQGNCPNWEITNQIRNISVSQSELPKYAYTINYTYGGETISSEEGTEYAGLKVDASKSSMWNAGNTQKYYVANNATTSFEVTDNVASNVFEVALREAETWNYTVKAVDGSSNPLKDLSTGSVTEGESVTVAYPQYVLSGTTLYSRAHNSSGDWYRNSITPGQNEYVYNVTYNGATKSDVIFYSEAESISGVTTQGYTNRASNGLVAKTGSNSTFVDVVKLPAGKYKIWAKGLNGNNSAKTIIFKVGNTEVYNFSITQGTDQNGESEEFTVAETSMLSFAGECASTGGLDLFYVYGTPDNEIIGDFIDYSTDFLGDTKDLTIAQGKKMVLNFKNHGGSSNWLNWVLRTYQDEGIDYRLRADNYATDATGASAWSDDDDKMKWDILVDGAAPSWSTIWTEFPGQMADANVEMVITYTNAGKFSMCATSTGSSKTYTHKFVCGEALSGDVKLQLGVWNSWIEFVSATTTNIETVSKAISDAKWATFCSDKSLDFTGVDGLTAYVVTGGAEGILSKTSVGDIPSNTGVLLSGNATTYNIPVVAASMANVSANKFVGVTTNTEIAANAGYVLMASPSLGFYQNSNAFTVGANTAYLPADFDGTGAARFFSFDNEATGINSLTPALSEGEGAVFNLRGQRVNQPAKGLYIVNGRKVLVK